MNDTSSRRVTIDGVGSYDSVDCDVLDVNGTAKVDGPVDATEVDVDGTAKVGGDVRAERVSGDGTVKFGGAVSADRVRVDGTGKVSGNLDGHDVQVDGTLKVGGSLVAAEASIDGTAKVDGATDVTDLTVDGTAKFDTVNADTVAVGGNVHAGDVTAREFDLTVGGRSEVGSLEATDVVVRDADEDRGVSNWLAEKLQLGGERVFEAGTIVGETVELDATRADTVVGDGVTLGPNAEVETVYTDDLDAHADASVGETRPRDAY